MGMIKTEMKKRDTAVKKYVLDKIGKISIFILFALAVAGCLSRSKPAYMMEYFMFEYKSPAAGDLVVLSEPIKVERFSVNKSFNTQAMIYKSYPFKFMAYNYSKWRVNPADMVTDYLLRDMSNANIFANVFSHHNIENPRFIVEGHVQDFLEETDNKTINAILGVNISLLDTSRKNISRRVIFQKQYNFQEQVGEHRPESFAKGMSINMSRLSEELMKDINEAIVNVTGPAGPDQTGVKSETSFRHGDR